MNQNSSELAPVPLLTDGLWRTLSNFEIVHRMASDLAKNSDGARWFFECLAGTVIKNDEETQTFEEAVVAGWIFSEAHPSVIYPSEIKELLWLLQERFPNAYYLGGYWGDEPAHGVNIVTSMMEFDAVEAGFDADYLPTFLANVEAAIEVLGETTALTTAREVTQENIEESRVAKPE